MDTLPFELVHYISFYLNSESFCSLLQTDKYHARILTELLNKTVKEAYILFFNENKFNYWNHNNWYTHHDNWNNGGRYNGNHEYVHIRQESSLSNRRVVPVQPQNKAMYQTSRRSYSPSYNTPRMYTRPQYNNSRIDNNITNRRSQINTQSRTQISTDRRTYIQSNNQRSTQSRNYSVPSRSYNSGTSSRSYNSGSASRSSNYSSGSYSSGSSSRSSGNYSSGGSSSGGRSSGGSSGRR